MNFLRPEDTFPVTSFIKVFIFKLDFDFKAAFFYFWLFVAASPVLTFAHSYIFSDLQ